jgi:hypothetical protein
MDDLNFLVPAAVFIQKYINENLGKYTRYHQWPEEKAIPYLSRRATEAWEKAIVSHAMKGNRLPAAVIDSWADMHGVTGYGGVFHTFRGNAERAIQGWMPKDLRD